MGPLLRGFTDELIKVAQTDWSSVTRPSSTATGNERTPRPSNQLGPSNAMLRAIPTQRMESPAGAAQQTWRPSPGYRPKPASDPKPAAPVQPRKGGVTRPANAQPAWESSGQMHARKDYEASFNQGRAGGPMPASMANAPGSKTPRPLSNTERGFVAGQGAPKIQPSAPGGLQKNPLQAAGFRPPKPPGGF